MMYEDVIRDFAKRTWKNLAMIEQLQRDGKEVYETTQLINSCLGLPMFPQQHFIDKIPYTSMEQLAAEGWPIPQVTGQFCQVTNLNDLIRYLRNAIAHFNIMFIANSKNEITSLRVWNSNRGRTTWEAELSVNDLRSIIEKFSGMLIDYRIPNKSLKRNGRCFDHWHPGWRQCGNNGGGW